jgi:hypothetical protein
MRVLKTIRYNILRDGDRHLRGKIAEEVFARVKDKLIRSFILQVNTYHFTSFLSEYERHEEVIEWILTRLSEGLTPSQIVLEASRELELFRKEMDVSVNGEGPAALEGFCIMCFKRGEVKVRGLYPLKLCGECLEKCLKRGYVRGVEDARFSFLTERFEIVPEKHEFERAVERVLQVTSVLRGYEGCLRLFSMLAEGERAFLHETLYIRGSGQHPFDFIAVGDDGSKYLIDVTSTKGEHSHAPLSFREKDIAGKAVKAGFRILTPVVRFDANWTVKVELIELTAP